jgi:hypothetical protein
MCEPTPTPAPPTSRSSSGSGQCSVRQRHVRAALVRPALVCAAFCGQMFVGLAGSSENGLGGVGSLAFGNKGDCAMHMYISCIVCVSTPVWTGIAVRLL